MREKADRTPYDLVPFEEIVDAYSDVAEYGEGKYKDGWNWTKGLPRSQILSSLLRHAFAILRGENYDKESGLLHSHHVLWNAVALTHAFHHGINDDIRAEPDREYKRRKKENEKA